MRTPIRQADTYFERRFCVLTANCSTKTITILVSPLSTSSPTTSFSSWRGLTRPAKRPCRISLVMIRRAQGVGIVADWGLHSSTSTTTRNSTQTLASDPTSLVGRSPTHLSPTFSGVSHKLKSSSRRYPKFAPKLTSNPGILPRRLRPIPTTTLFHLSSQTSQTRAIPPQNQCRIMTSLSSLSPT